MFAAVGALPFAAIRIGWTIVQYLLFVSAVLLLARHMRGGERVLLWAAGIVLVLSSAHWHMHVERGQVYLLFSFLMVVAFVLAERGDRRALLVLGGLIAVLAVFKPPFALLGLPFLLARRWPVVIGGSIVAGGLLGLFAATGLMSDWKDYSAAMNQWAITNFDTRTGPPPADQPVVIEGLATLRSHLQFEADDASIRGMLLTLTGRRLSPKSCLLLMAAMVIIVMGAFLHRSQRFSAVDLLLLGFVVWMLTVAAMPAPRITYQLVQWLGPLLIVVRDRRHYAAVGVALVVGGSLAGLRLFALLPHSYVWGEIVMVLGLLSLLWTRAGRHPAMAPPGPDSYTP